MMERFGLGLMAGAAGTTALNFVGYTDMLVRGRSASSMPAEVASSLADRIELPLGSALSERRKPREEALGALLGLANGILIGVAYGALHPTLQDTPGWARALIVGGAAMLASDGPAVALEKTDPRTWTASSWVSDILPHLAYGIVVVLVFQTAGRRTWPFGADKRWSV